MGPKYLTSADAVDICRENGFPNCGRATISKWRVEHDLGDKVAGRLRIDRKKLLKFLGVDDGQEKIKTKKNNSK